MRTADIGKLDKAAWLFPYEFRFRVGPYEPYLNSSDDPKALPVLLHAQQLEPNSPSLAAAIMIHALRMNQQELASAEFRKLYELAPRSKMVRELLARRRDP